MAKEDLLNVLRRLLSDALQARFEGGPHAKFARAHGYADGFMRALLDAGLADKDELIALVGAERRRFVDADDNASSARELVA